MPILTASAARAEKLGCSNVDTLSFADGILINGVPLVTLLQVYEEPMARAEGFAPLAGDYGQLSHYDLYKSLRKAASKGHPAVPVLDCSCGCSGCWTLKLTLRVEPESVSWTGFEQIHRSQAHNRWDYSNFGPFRFSREHYAEQMRTLKRLARLARADNR